ncbi:MAG: metallophosphoesterase [Desulfobacterales bacterium]|nr:metallophosphoesterase [Desulfobacterales bacterium]
MSLFILFLLSALTLFIWFTGFRFIQILPVGNYTKALLWFTLVYGLLFAPFLFYLRALGLQGTTLDLVAWSGYLLMGLYSILICGVIGRDIFLGFCYLIEKWNGAPLLKDPSRRGLLIQGVNIGLAGISTGITGTALFKAMAPAQIVTITHPLEKKLQGLYGLRIVQISDIHVSHTIRRPMVKRIVKQVNALKPDIVVLTGDLVDGSVPMLKKDVAPLKTLVAPMGLFFVTGNHEYYSGVMPWIEEVRQLGFTCLINNHTVLTHNKTPLVIAGVTDYHAGRMVPQHASDVATALEGAPEEAYRLLLAHQPLSFPEAQKNHCHLTLSGHTHGGQYFPYNLAIHLAQPWVAGLYEQKEARLYVNRGSAFWGPPLRLGSPSEITLHILGEA